MDNSITYSCKRRYKIVGDSRRKCQYGGNWTGSAPVCLKGKLTKSFDEHIQHNIFNSVPYFIGTLI